MSNVENKFFELNKSVFLICPNKCLQDTEQWIWGMLV